MEKMEGFHVHLLLLLVTFIQGIQGQVIRPSSVTVAVNDTVSLECTTGAPDGFTFSWLDVTKSEILYIDGTKNTPLGLYENFLLDEDKPAKKSTLNINSILLQDAGEYRCVVSGQSNVEPATVKVEGGSVSPPIAMTSINDDTNYQATCEARGSSVEEAITWILDGVTQTAGPPTIVETDPQISDDPLFDKRSVFIFPVNLETYNVPLECNISGHQVSKLNRQVYRLVDIHKSPQPADIVIDFNSDGTSLDVLCNTDDAAAVPPMNEFYIYSNGTLLDKSTLSQTTVTVTVPDQDTNFTCVGANYLGNTTTTKTYQPGRTTPLPTPTAPTSAETTSPETNDAGNRNGSEPKVAAIVGGVIGGIVLIIIIVLVIWCVVIPRCKDRSGSSGGGPRKPTSSAVGSSNGNEKEKIKPSAAPRTASSIQHTTDNPDQAEYAMVDRKPAGGKGGGGDVPDTRGGYGAGQNEPGMVYADLDLSSKAGHTERQVPKDTENVVVYSSILV